MLIVSRTNHFKIGMIHGLVGTEGVGNIAQQVVAEEGVYDTIVKHIKTNLISLTYILR